MENEIAANAETPNDEKNSENTSIEEKADIKEIDKAMENEKYVMADIKIDGNDKSTNVSEATKINEEGKINEPREDNETKSEQEEKQLHIEVKEDLENVQSDSWFSNMKTRIPSVSIPNSRTQTYNNLSDAEIIEMFSVSKPGDFVDVNLYEEKDYSYVREEINFRRKFGLKKEKRSKRLLYGKVIEAPAGFGATFDYYKENIGDVNKIAKMNQIQDNIAQDAIEHIQQGQQEIQTMKYFNSSPYFVHVYCSNFSTFSVSNNEKLSVTNNGTDLIVKDENKWIKVRIYLEFCPKGSLQDNLSVSVLNNSTRYKWYIQTLLSIYEMHKNNISHNDIKPDNFLITNHDDCKAADFGAIQRGKTPSLAKEYTRFFAAPELINATLLGYNLFTYDIFSLGITFLLMLEGDQFIAWKKQECIGVRLSSENNEFSDFNHYENSKFFNLSINIIEKILILNMIKRDPSHRITLHQCIYLVEMLNNNTTCTMEELLNFIDNKNYCIDENKLQMLYKKYEPKNDLIIYKSPKLSKCEELVRNFGIFIFIGMIIAWITLISISIAINHNSDSVNTQTIIGWTIFNMILSPIIMSVVGLCSIKMWKPKIWYITFFIIYLLLLIDIGALQQHILQPLLIIYLVVKIAVIGLAFLYAKVDGKYFFPSIIKNVITINFFKIKTKFYYLFKYFILCIIIQIIIFSISCTALLNMSNLKNLSGVRIAAFIFTIWIINVPRHFLHYVAIRMITNSLEQNESSEEIREAFKSAKNKLTTIAIGSFFVTISPFWNFVANLMWFLKYVGTCIFVCGIASEEERSKRTQEGCIYPLICCCVGACISGFSFVAEKISKFFLSITSKSILTIAGINDIDYFNAMITQFKVLNESKETFGAKMVFLDNGMVQMCTHLCILCSSIGCWITIDINSSMSFVVWIAGYVSCRTIFELIDLTLQFFLISWSVRPDLLYGLDDIYLNLQTEYEDRNKGLENALGDKNKISNNKN